MATLFDSGIRPAIDEYLRQKSLEVRSYGDYWSGSSAGYCMRKLIFERLGVPPVEKTDDARKQRVFEAGHIFHEWVQRITKKSGLSIAQELEVQDEGLMVRGHIDDLVLFGEVVASQHVGGDWRKPENYEPVLTNPRLILYDYKTQHANAFTWQKGRPVSYYHLMQAGTYLYILRQKENIYGTATLKEARILKISKDDLRMDENQILWDAKLEKQILDFWNSLNDYWNAKKIPPCTCADHENGFMAKEKFNPYFYEGEPCSIKLYEKFKEMQSVTKL